MKSILPFSLFLASVAFAGDKTYFWDPPTSEYSCVFQGMPQFKDVETTIDGNRIICPTGEYLGDEGFERADFMPYVATERITKDIAIARMSQYATDYGMAHFDVSFDDSKPADITATLRASKTINTHYGDVIMQFYAVCHWGRKTIFTQTIGETAKTYPSKQGQAFLSSIRQKGQ